MKFAQTLESIKPVEIVFIALFIVFLVLPMNMPPLIASVIDTPIGIVVLLIIVLGLFFYSNPILAIIFVFVAYELLRRSSIVSGRVGLVQYTPSQIIKDNQIAAMNPPKTVTLEEEVVQQMAPIGHSDPVNYTSSTYKPVAQPVGSASMF